jgi:hypothetical protein
VHREWRSFEKSEYQEGVCGLGFAISYSEWGKIKAWAATEDLQDPSLVGAMFSPKLQLFWSCTVLPIKCRQGSKANKSNCQF